MSPTDQKKAAPTSAEGAPSGAKLFESLNVASGKAKTVSLDADGKATVKFTTSYKVSKPGYYVWKEKAVPYKDPSGNKDKDEKWMYAADSTFGRVSETTLVVGETVAAGGANQS